MSMSSLLRPASTNPVIYVSSLPSGVTSADLAEKFGSIGVIKKDKQTKEPKIRLYKDKETGEAKGDAVITYDDPSSASAAVEWFNGTEFKGVSIKVELAAQKESEPRGYQGSRRGFNAGSSGGGASGSASGATGDWDCPQCGNMNFARRSSCFKCQTSRPGGGAGGAGGAPERGSGPQQDGDWFCGMCGNENWARRSSCNRCNTPKPSGNAERRTGRGGGFNDRQDISDNDRDQDRGRDRDRDHRDRGEHRHRDDRSDRDRYRGGGRGRDRSPVDRHHRRHNRSRSPRR